MEALLILREEVYSPGRVQDDAAILTGVGNELARIGVQVEYVTGEIFGRRPLSGRFDIVLAKCEGVDALAKLDDVAARGIRVINSPASIRRCSRSQMISLLKQASLPIPASEYLETRAYNAAFLHWPAGGFWLKRGDFHAMSADDVIRVTEPQAMQRALKMFGDRGFDRVLAQEHVDGSTLKCYSVGAGFFLSCHPSPGAVVQAQVERISEKIADVFALDVFGFDVIVSADESVSTIDVNDWPTFAPCAGEAARAIATYVTSDGGGASAGTCR